MGTSSSADQMNAGSVVNNSNKYRYLWGKLNWTWTWTWTCRSTDFWTQVTKNTIARRSKWLLHGGRESPPYSYVILPTSVPGSITSYLSSFHQQIRKFPFYITQQARIHFDDSGVSDQKKYDCPKKKKFDSPAIELLKSGGAKRIELNESFSCYISPASYFGDYSVQPAVFSR